MSGKFVRLPNELKT